MTAASILGGAFAAFGSVNFFESFSKKKDIESDEIQDTHEDVESSSNKRIFIERLLQRQNEGFINLAAQLNVVNAQINSLNTAKRDYRTDLE